MRRLRTPIRLSIAIYALLVPVSQLAFRPSKLKSMAFISMLMPAKSLGTAAARALLGLRVIVTVCCAPAIGDQRQRAQGAQEPQCGLHCSCHVLTPP